MVNNNEKIMNLLLVKENLNPIIPGYLDALKKRYEWTKNARSEFFKAKRTINALSVEMARNAKKYERQDEKITETVAAIRKESIRLLDDNPEISHEGKRGLEELSELKVNNFTQDYAETMVVYIKKNVRVSKRKLLALLRKKYSATVINQERIILAKQLAKRLNSLLITYMNRGYKQFELIAFVEDATLIVKEMKDNNFQDQADELQEVVNRLNNWQEPARPNPEELIEVLHEARKPDMYVKRGYTVMNYTRPVYKNMNYFHRALREKREYVGTQNAYKRLIDKLDDLEAYYRQHYVQAGGKPSNYHGHYAGEKP